MLVASPSLSPLLATLTYTFLQKHHNPLSSNSFGIIDVSHRHPVLALLQKSATAIPQCRGLSHCCFERFCSGIIDRCFFCRNLATNTFFHLWNALQLGCSILLPNCFKENSVCCKLIGALTLAAPKSDKSSLSSSVSNAS